MNWALRYRLRSFLRSSMCVAPIACVAAALLAAPLLRGIDQRTQWTLLGAGPDGSRAIAEVLASSLLTFIVFAFSIILLAVQIASGQLSPRIIARLFESRAVKLTLGVFLFSYTYNLATLGRIEDHVPQLPVLVAVLSSLFSVVLFLYLIQLTGSSLRPGVILAAVAADTGIAIRAVYPIYFLACGGDNLGPDFGFAKATRTITHVGRAGTVLAFDTATLAKLARRADCTIELVPQAGDFLATGEDLFRLRGAGAAGVNDRSLRHCIALGPEQIIENDPVYGFRILVEIATKALSPAINDPTTAVLAVDQIHHLLLLLGRRQLGTAVIQDSSEEPRFVYRTPCWEDYVALSVTEIRLYGAASPQVTRRLQAMYEHLIQVLPDERVGTLRKEVALLRRSIDRDFADPEDRAVARVRDLQGFGSRQPDYISEKV